MTGRDSRILRVLVVDDDVVEVSDHLQAGAGERTDLEVGWEPGPAGEDGTIEFGGRTWRYDLEPIGRSEPG